LIVYATIGWSQEPSLTIPSSWAGRSSRRGTQSVPILSRGRARRRGSPDRITAGRWRSLLAIANEIETGGVVSWLQAPQPVDRAQHGLQRCREYRAVEADAPPDPVRAAGLDVGRIADRRRAR